MVRYVINAVDYDRWWDGIGWTCRPEFAVSYLPSELPKHLPCPGSEGAPLVLADDQETYEDRDSGEIEASLEVEGCQDL